MCMKVCTELYKPPAISLFPQITALQLTNDKVSKQTASVDSGLYCREGNMISYM